MLHFVRCCLIALLLNATLASAQGVRDPELPETRLFQTLPSISAKFPKGVDGKPDWVRTLNEGLIAPRTTKTGAPRPAETLGEMPSEGIVFKNTLFMPYVVFPHQPHAEWLACSNCHEALFGLQATGRGRGMTAIFRGEHCGFCHGRVAFSPEGSCYRCHSRPNPTAVQNQSPFTAPAVIEQPVKLDDGEKKPRRGQGKPVPTAGRLAPSIVPQPSAQPVLTPEAPVLQ